MAADTPKLPRLPACQRCYQRKAKCDSDRPQCAPCVQSKTPCLMVIPGANEPISRQTIHDLEVRQRELVHKRTDNTSTAIEHLSHRETPRSTFESPHSTVHGIDGNGPNFIRALFADAQWREDNAHLLQNLANPPRPIETSLNASQLPPADEARVIFDKYLAGSNVMCPVLLRSDVDTLYLQVFDGEASSSLSPHDRFRAFMILAIGAVVLHRRGLHAGHPYGYYLSAIKDFTLNFDTAAGLGCIVDLLLIGRFGVYHNIGISIWDINQLCMRLCIAQSLHRHSSSSNSLLHEQLQRRAFWECYIIDRYSSIVLDRPFAISDRDISVGLPVELRDEQIMAFEGQVKDLDSIVPQDWNLPSEMSVFCFCIRLRRITSRMRTLLTQANGWGISSQEGPESPSNTGKIFAALDDLLGDLDEWRETAPAFAAPRSLYEMPDWYDLLKARERLIFIRKAVDLVPKSNGMPSEELLLLCLHAAIHTIVKYSSLFDRKIVTHTRSYYQTLFLAGLSILFCVSVLPSLAEPLLVEAHQTLWTCERTLRELGMSMPDAANFILVFEALLHHIMQTRLASMPPSRDPLVTAPAFDNERLASLPQHAAFASQSDVQYDLTQNVPVQGVQGLGSQHMPWQTFNDQAGVNFDMGHGFSQALNDFVPDEMLSRAFLQDNAIWNFEAGLGNYVYGEASLDINLLDGFNFHF